MYGLQNKVKGERSFKLVANIHFQHFLFFVHTNINIINTDTKFELLLSLYNIKKSFSAHDAFLLTLMSIDFPIDNTEDIEDAHNPWTEGSENESVDLDKIYESEMISEAENIDNSPHNS